MARGLHLVSCYLPNNDFVDRFLQETAGELAQHEHELLLLPTYTPAADNLRYIQIDYTLAGFAQLTRPRAGTPFGLVPAALSDVESAWTRWPADPSTTAEAIATCSAFFGRLLDEMEPDTVSVWNPTVPQGRLLQAACLTRGIPHFGIERGVFPETMMLESREVGAQSDLTMNPIVRSVLQRQPAQPECLAALREYYTRRDFSRYPMAPRCAGTELRRGLRIPDQARVVVLFLSVAAANWHPRSMPGTRFTSPWLTSAEHAIESLLRVLPNDTYLIVQDHPLDRGFWRSPTDTRLRHTRGEHLQTLFEAGDALAFLGATTVQHEALLTEKPLLLLSRSQLSGQGVAYEYRGEELAALVESALHDHARESHAEAIARYIPFLFEHVLFGCTGGPTRMTAVDLAHHFEALASGHTLDPQQRIERWLLAAAQDAAQGDADTEHAMKETA